MSQYRKAPKKAVLRSASSDKEFHDANAKAKEAYREMKRQRRLSKKKPK